MSSENRSTAILMVHISGPDVDVLKQTARVIEALRAVEPHGTNTSVDSPRFEPGIVQTNNILEILIATPGLFKERPRNLMTRAGITTLGELTLKTETELHAITNFGQKSVDEVIEVLDQYGLRLRGS